MVLLIDVGNTLTKFGFAKNNKMFEHIESFPTKEITPTEIKRICENRKVDKCYIGSVVPSVNDQIVKSIKSACKITPEFLTMEDFKKVLNLSKFKEEIGVDILGYAYFLSKKYTKAIGICFGTAMFAIGVDGKDIYGAIITPYIEKGIRELLARTEMMKLQKRQSFQKTFYDFGTNTVEALTSGVNHFYMGFANNICEHFNNKYGFKKLCITGGNQNKIQYSPFIIKTFDTERIDNGVLRGYLYLVSEK